MQPAMRWICGVLLLCTAVTAGWAQQLTGTITGRVLDSSGAAIPGATVTVRDDQRGIVQSVKTNRTGEYVVPLLPPSNHYTVTAEKESFKKTVQGNVILQVAQTENIDLTLSLGSVSSVITVDASAVSLDTQTSSLGQVITGDTVEDLPLNGRSTFRLIELTPGVTFSDSANGQTGDVPVNTTYDTNFAINGGRSQSNEFLIDGIPTATGFFNQITTMPIVDELQEFKVESSNLSAAYGRFSGGVINVSTKSGTNDLHGDVFEFLRNSAFDARDWFSAHNGIAIPAFHMNQFGGTVGGPVILPWLYNGKDKTFFFISYQGTRRIQGQPYYGNVPTAAERTGDFSAFSANLFNPFSYNPTTDTRAQFSNKTIPSTLLDPVAVAMMKYYPLPNVPGVTGTGKDYFAAAPNNVDQNVYSLRIDETVNPRYHFFGRYEYSHTPFTQPNEYGNIADHAGAVGTTDFNNQSFAFNNTVILSPTLLLNVSYGFARWFQLRKTLSYGFDNTTLGFPSALVAKESIPMFPNISISGFAQLAGQSYLHNGNDSHSILVNFTKVIGAHTLTFGVDGRMHRINYFNASNTGGAYSFDAQFTRKNDSTTAGGNGFASFLLGAGASGYFPQIVGQAIEDFYGGIYIQDNWRITPQLTLNAGIRYDGESPYTERHNELNYFDPNVASAAANPEFPDLTGGLVFAGTGNVGRKVYSRDHLNIGPRVGFAFAPNPDIVFRGAFGIVYAPLELSNNAVGFIPALGYSATTSWNPAVPTSGLSTVPKDLISNPFPNGVLPISGNSAGTLTQLGQSITVWNRRAPTPYAEQWNFDVQVHLPFSALLDAAYAGSTGVHLTEGFEHNSLPFSTIEVLGANANQGVPNPFASMVGVGPLSQPYVSLSQLLLPYPQFTSVFEVNNPWGHSVYNSGQFKFVKRSSRKGITITSALTWSKLISNVNAQAANIGTVNSTSVQDYSNLKAERAVSEFDIPYVFITHFIYALPFGRGQAFFSHGGWTDKLIGGWRANGIWQEQRGFPLTLSVTNVPGGANRPVLVPGQDPVIHGRRSNEERVNEYFNTAAFTVPQAYYPGTLQRTFPLLRQPGIQNLDFALMKDTRFGRFRTEFRAEAFNITNTPHFSPPGDTINGGNFGQILNTRGTPPPRELQFAIKIFF